MDFQQDQCVCLCASNTPILFATFLAPLPQHPPPPPLARLKDDDMFDLCEEY